MAVWVKREDLAEVLRQELTRCGGIGATSLEVAAAGGMNEATATRAIFGILNADYVHRGKRVTKQLVTINKADLLLTALGRPEAWHVELADAIVLTGADRPVEGPSVRDKCANGHPLTEANLYVRPDGGRRCRVCARVTGARHMRRERGPVAPPGGTATPSTRKKAA